MAVVLQCIRCLTLFRIQIRAQSHAVHAKWSTSRLARTKARGPAHPERSRRPSEPGTRLARRSTSESNTHENLGVSDIYLDESPGDPVTLRQEIGVEFEGASWRGFRPWPLVARVWER